MCVAAWHCMVRVFGMNGKEVEEREGSETARHDLKPTTAAKRSCCLQEAHRPEVSHLRGPDRSVFGRMPLAGMKPSEVHENLSVLLRHRRLANSVCQAEHFHMLAELFNSASMTGACNLPVRSGANIRLLSEAESRCIYPTRGSFDCSRRLAKHES